MEYNRDVERHLTGGEKGVYGRKNLSDTSTACLESGALPATGSKPYRSDSGEVGEVRHVSPDFIRQKEAEGQANFKRLGWKRLTIVLIVEAVALGSLSLPSAFATLGMFAGVVCSVGLGVAAVYSSYVVGQLKLKYPEISHYADAGRLMFGKWGYEIFSFMFTVQLIFIIGSHVLTGTIMWNNITEGGNGTCAIAFGVVSAIILFLVAIPPSFAEVAILGYIDFASILGAILITMIGTGIQAHRAEGGLDAVHWSAWPKPGVSLHEAFIAICNIVFAYSFALCQFSFMDEMHTPRDFSKSIIALGGIEIVLYTLTGALIYSFVGVDVASPALLSAGHTLSKVAFGIALPVIFISGSINTVVVGRYIHGRIFKNSIIRFINTPKGWATWLALDAIITLIAWIVAEAIPFFSPLLAISSSLFISGFTFYLPSVMWFMFIVEGRWYERRNWACAAANITCFLIGMIVLGLGTYSAIKDIMIRYSDGIVSTPFSCTAPS
ncbi:transmembrane amino acid transporter protein-domain-containing protein [Podospora aff. communis PSN243]|uniref:Transmembrane amino acid transporter protein-domain-containing protein n=1 Tax=Podospora aff. communis PSN243 TaxID=3040156 RepID=A0AAV9GP81_9PEZI|nr:transmembrane amino acid transporter protein-domain-containing protein [Podospora aff. communis PSN243]